MPRDRRHMSGTVYAPSRWVPHVGGVGSSAQKKGRDGARFIPPGAAEGTAHPAHGTCIPRFFPVFRRMPRIVFSLFHSRITHDRALREKGIPDRQGSLCSTSSLTLPSRCSLPPNRAPRLAPMASGALPGCVLRAGASYRHAGLAGVAHQALTLAAP